MSAAHILAMGVTFTAGNGKDGTQPGIKFINNRLRLGCTNGRGTLAEDAYFFRILRCADPAIPTEESLVCDPETSKKIFKVKNTYDVGGVVAAYNLDSEESPVTGTISAADIGADYDEYVIYEHFSGEVTVLKRGEVLEVTLKDHDDFRLYNIVPVTDGMAVLGLIDKFNAPMAAKHEFGGVYSLYEGGRFAFVCTDGKTRTVTTESGVYQPVADGKLCTVELPLTDRHAEIK